jgi:hypothetical protein
MVAVRRKPHPAPSLDVASRLVAVYAEIMGQTTFSLAPRQIPMRAQAGHGLACPFASNCSCVFARVQESEREPAATNTALDDERVRAEVTTLTDRGWKVTTASDREVVLQRTRGLSFCANLFLCLATGMLWLLYWVPRSLRPRIDTRVVLLTPSGDVAVVLNGEHDAAEHLAGVDAPMSVDRLVESQDVVHDRV